MASPLPSITNGGPPVGQLHGPLQARLPRKPGHVGSLHEIEGPLETHGQAAVHGPHALFAANLAAFHHGHPKHVALIPGQQTYLRISPSSRTLWKQYAT